MLTVGGVLWQSYVSFAPNRTHACNVPLPLWSLTSFSRGLQGGGVFVYGVANFQGCNIHDNTADDVCLNFP